MASAHKDRGFRSLKFIMAVFAMALCTAGYAAICWLPALAGQYNVFVGAINGVAALYMVGNAGSQWVAAKHGKALAPEPTPEAESDTKS